MPIIEVYKGKTPAGSFVLTEDIITIGRAGDNEIVLPDQSTRVSRYHAVLLKCSPGEGYSIRDLSSAWGTRIGNRQVFQKVLTDGDTIHILDFRLKYGVSNQNTSIFKITDESVSAVPSYLPQNIGQQSTSIRRVDDILEASPAEFRGEAKLLFEEFLHQVTNPGRLEKLLDSAMHIVFYTLSMGENGFGCLALFEGEDSIKCLGSKGMESRTSIPLPRFVIEKIKTNQPVIMDNQLWAPIHEEENATLGFLYVDRGTYAPCFQENETKLVSLICRMLAEAISGGIDNDISHDEEAVKWPRNLICNKIFFKEIKRLALLDRNVLVLGETGVGKEAAAEEIHRLSYRRNKELRKVNCSAIPKDLVESELFGHKKGAFTGATEEKKGEFELANGGTIFLDEIGDLPWESQRKLLRVTQEKVIKRLGEERDIKVDMRIIAATNRDIYKDMEDGRFGSDLYYRFGEQLIIPPLRERKKEITLLIHYFFDEFAQELNIQPMNITPQAMKCLLSYPWPGNIRELKDCIYAALSSSKGVIALQHLQVKVQKQRKTDKTEEVEVKEQKTALQTLEEAEKDHIMETLKYTCGNKDKAIEILKIAKQTFYNKLKKYNIPADFGKS